MMNKGKVIGVTGETGGGKSTFLHYVQKRYNSYIIDLDKMVHELLADEEVKAQLTDYFSDAILDKGTVSRQRLGAIVFNDKKALAYLSQVIHPRVTENLKKILFEKQTQYAFILVEGIALVEAGIDTLCDAIIYIQADPDIRLKRLVEQRHISRKRSKEMMASQKPSSFYQRHATYTLSLTQGIETKEHEIKKMFQEIL